jgi:tetratricopeptide (TPR) repeat protein
MFRSSEGAPTVSTEEERWSKLEAARRMSGPDTDTRMAIFRELGDGPRGPTWSEAKVELAQVSFSQADYAACLAAVREVLNTDPSLTSPESRAMSQVILCNTRDLVEDSFDAEILSDGIAQCQALGLSYHAGIGLGLRARVRKASGDRDGAREDLRAAVAAYDAAGSMLAGPNALARLAAMEAEEGRPAEASALLDHAIERLRQFPLGGFQVRKTEEKLLKQRADYRAAAGLSD